ncbi:ribulose phosphate epimerase [Paraliomyxa miuraensis]|uniref:ribulose phosphate epimerase n=1 Tax=Paraliomyxa miuraensis TaxID=376150 RepID=UPI0022504FBD|nr:ribulose phosphate epimerase [Paraliomyxa miuraensis]MCX4241144.1 ribulose phosphate epimerase [Paraliomyxa miuraensis]
MENTISLLDDDGGSSSTGDGPTTATTTLPDPTSPSTTLPDPADDTTPDPDSAGFQFIPTPEGGSWLECDLYAQDCPPGEKCMPWANDGGPFWNATRCSPIAEDPGAPGDPCMVEGSGVSGIDDCELGSMCWNVDPETNEGSCVALCSGSVSNPYCEDPGTYCAISADEFFELCLPQCQPVEQDCPDGQACYPIQDRWSCAPDASGDMGAYGDPCEFINVCDPGLVCLSTEAAPPGLPCEGAFGCCLEVCALSLGDAQCSGVAEGEICQPWYEEEATPFGYDDVGVCALAS